ncbi:hypothetical protein [Maridesulfovibrio sp.]
MTQTASISSINKKKFLKKAFKSFSVQAERKNKDPEHQALPVTAKDIERS